MNKAKKILITTLIGACACLSCVAATKSIYQQKLNEAKAKYNLELKQINIEKNNYEKQYTTYKYMYESQENDIQTALAEAKTANAELQQLKSSIILSRQEEDRLSRSSGYENKDLSKFGIMTVEEMNKWIAERAPKDSPFIGNGALFLRASAETKLDPKYLVAHAALESTWGTSPISQVKNNYFGIGAFNTSPMKSAYKFGSGLEAGIMEGAMWIKENYYNNNQITLNQMIYGEQTYCVEDNGRPSQSWIDKIKSIAY